MGDRPQACAPDDHRSAVVALVAEPGLSAVQGEANFEGSLGRPRFLGKGPLHIERGGECIGRDGERTHDAVTLALLDRPGPTVGRDCDVEELVVTSDRSCGELFVGFPESGRPLDVAEEERHRACRQGGISCSLVVQSQQAPSRLGRLPGKLCHSHPLIVTGEGIDNIGQMADMTVREPAASPVTWTDGFASSRDSRSPRRKPGRMSPRWRMFPQLTRKTLAGMTHVTHPLAAESDPTKRECRVAGREQAADSCPERVRRRRPLPRRCAPPGKSSRTCCRSITDRRLLRGPARRAAHRIHPPAHRLGAPHLLPGSAPHAGRPQRSAAGVNRP